MPRRGPGVSYDVTTPEGTLDTEFYSVCDVIKWFATTAEVRQMFGPEELVLNASNEQQILSGAEENSLRFTNLEVDSEAVKKITESAPPDTLTITDYTAQSLTHSRLVNGKIRIFDSVSESTLLENGVDYEVDYYKGTVTLTEPDFTAGDASAGAAVLPTFDTEFYCEVDVQIIVIVHYKYYALFVRGTDYTINYTLGRIARKFGGSIESGELVYIDYKITQLADNALIELIIDMTHEWILAQIGTAYKDSTAKKLRYAEINLSVSNIARSIVSKVINEGLAGSPNVHSITRNLKRIEESFRDLGMQFLQSYLSYGITYAGKVKQNAVFD